MSGLEKLRGSVLQRLLDCQCKMSYDSYIIAEIEGELRSLRWALCMIDKLIQEENNG